ncbi:Peptidoglycan deacetylase [Penicillium lagena]|uniref:Peptidoglycan deacetylase n=1 Tax=Penicillium lagena TaxID=94218 RepID=UPI002540A206|nr:Peptidoglycan deacetylase [Penicillium lagena]KAJ5619452.1 Peptidoglycan deacetylase [Penicillium lagena]
MSFLGLEGYHVFITGAAGGIGFEATQEFLTHGCKVTAHDLRPIAPPSPANPNFFAVQGDTSCETSIQKCIAQAVSHFGPINILVANDGITDESARRNIWEIPLDVWEKTYRVNIQGTYLTIKHFLLAVSAAQTAANGTELENVAIVVTGSETGKFGQAGHSEYASGKAGIQYGLVRSVKNEIVRLNCKARINAVAPGWIGTPLIEGRLDDPTERWREAEATVPLRKIAKPRDIARAMAFLTSHRAAGHITGQVLSVDGGMEGRMVWNEEEANNGSAPSTIQNAYPSQSAVLVNEIPPAVSIAPKCRVQVLLSVDFDAVSGFLGTGASPSNGLSDYSSGYFAAQVGVPRLLRLFQKHGIASSVTWFIPGHSMESFPKETKQIVDSGAEIGCHGYAHEGSSQMTEAQEREVIEKCVLLATELTGQRPRGWRAPLYQLREHTVQVLENLGFLYDSSLNHHDSSAYFLCKAPAITPIDFAANVSASSWMRPLPAPEPATSKTLVELPCNWYMEDMTPMQFLPAAPNSHGFVSPAQIEDNWKARFEFLHNEAIETGDGFLFPIVLHPDTSGMAHVIGMIDRTIQWLKAQGGHVEFTTYGQCAEEWKSRQNV